MTERHIIKVLLRGPDGRFLAGHQGAWTFTEDPQNARIFDYIGDRIPEQLEALETRHGLILTAVAVDPRERYETCDQCGVRIMSFRAYFDGTQYLCPDCREKSEGRDGEPAPPRSGPH